MATTAALVVVLLVGAMLRLVALDRLPPGLHFDEAVYGLLAEDIVRGARPVFFSSYTGREPLYMYVMAALFAGIGSTSMVIRLTSAFVGTATISITFALGRVMYGRRVGVVAAGLLAVSYWHLTVSRNGYPNILIPLIEALSAFFLWRAWRSEGRRWIDWALGGAFTGLVLYTYLAARFWPVFLVAFFVYVALVAHRDLKRNAAGVGVALAAAAVVFAPLAAHFWRNPHDFLERANQVLAWEQVEGSTLLRVYAHNVRETFAGFLGRGDPRWHYNLPGRSILQPLVGSFFLIGTLVALRRWRDIRYGFPLLWLLVLVLPGVLTLEMQPAGQRIFGVFPALVLVPAIGLEATARFVGRRLDPWLEGRLQGTRLSKRLPARSGSGVGVTGVGVTGVGVTGVALISIVLFTDGAVTVRDYFSDWVRQPETYHIFNSDYAALAPMAAADLAAGNTVVLLSEHYKHATLAFLAPDTVDQAVWADPAIALPIPVPRGDTEGELVYYRLSSYPDEDAPAIRWLGAHATDVRHIPSGFADDVLATHDVPPLDVVRYVVPRNAGSSDARPYAVDVGGEILVHTRNAGLSGLTAIRERDESGQFVLLPRDKDLVLPVEWSVVNPPDEGRGFALHLRDGNGITWAQTDVSGYLTEQWLPGDRVLQWFAVPFEPSMPPAFYTAHLMLVDAAARPIPARLPDGPSPSVPIAVVALQRDGRQHAAADVEPVLMLDGGLGVVSGGALDVQASPGATVVVEVLWGRFGDPSIRDFALLLIPDDGEPIALDTVPVAGNYEPSLWEERELLQGRYPVRLPADLADGTYELVVVPGGDGRVGQSPPSVVSFTAGTVRVDVGDRLFEAPAMGHELADVHFGSAVRLLGFDVDDSSTHPGGQVALTLYWQALDAPGSDAKVFTHLLSPDQKDSPQLVAQHDGTPADGSRPLSGWLPGEVVVDRHVIELPFDLAVAQGDPDIVELVLGVGLYDPLGGERWEIDVGGDPRRDRRLLLPVTVHMESGR